MRLRRKPFQIFNGVKWLAATPHMDAKRPSSRKPFQIFNGVNLQGCERFLNA